MKLSEADATTIREEILSTVMEGLDLWISSPMGPECLVKNSDEAFKPHLLFSSKDKRVYTGIRKIKQVHILVC